LDDLKDSSASAVLWERLFQKKEGYLAPLGADERGYCAEHVLAVAALDDSPASTPLRESEPPVRSRRKSSMKRL